ncbi:ochratoxin A non-ribosomal peptide synthetase [Arthroderma uncinatum]|uniref:ochratoxin A non-ribosomal peptide synthetase n=1 Tax=Arthroderma uncinatum TaxID=74035 RepID=UPI00144AB7C6|nr:ochratoxin A non-ribosomal peptide synthetase [Arthroderma uncinatum]KAF3480832.1 ochratoxin A non-ribosomal peptide synthetase [Arthroderma uncinatum]
MAVSSTDNIGKRLMAQVIDGLSETDPNRKVCTMPKGPDCSDGFFDLTFKQLAHTVNYMSWWIEESFGRSTSPAETLTYLGANDIRYLVIVMACNKTGYQPLLSSTRNSQAAQGRLLEMTGCSKVAYRFPKPIRLTYGYFGALDQGAHAEIPPGRTAGVPDRLTSDDLMMATTPFFHLMGFSLLIMAVFHGIPCVILPDKPLSTDLLTSVLNFTKPTAALFPPCILEDMSTSPEAMDALSDLKYVYFGGGPLATEIGHKISERTKLVSFLGMTEGGFVLSMVPQDEEDWSYFEWGTSFGIKMEAVADGLFEMVLHRRERPDLQPIFHTFPELERYHTKDLYSPHPTKPDLWKFHGRLDDVIILSNGLKCNPVTMEKIIEGHPLVSRAVIVGLGRFQTALLVEPNWSQWAEDSSEDTFIEQIWPTVREANRIGPTHGRVMKNRIGVASRSKPFSTTPKGSTQRRLVADGYKDEIEHIYTNPASEVLVYAIPETMDLAGITGSVRDIVSDALGLSEFTDKTDLYSIGLDSLQTLLLSMILQRSGFTSLTPQMVYSHPTVEKLSNFLYSLVSGTERNSISRSENIDALVKKYTDDLPNIESTNKHSVILTGSTGSLGTYLLNCLLADDTVSKVYCLNRSDAKERQAKNFEQRGLQPDALDKVEFLTASLNKERFGLAEDTYDELIRTVDTVIHNSWRMDFNISVNSFEDQIQSVRRLVDFSLRSVHRAHFYFNSSIGAIGEWKLAHGPMIPEIPLEICDVALRQGYGEAKHICERICQAASRAGVPTTILRLGQIAGPTTEAGIWSPSEWLPAIVATSKAIGKIPRTLGSMPIDWVPVDTLATIILEIIHSRQTTQVESRCSVFHLVNPSTTSWECLLPSIHDRYAAQRVSMKDWVEELERVEKPSARDISTKPALKLLPFYRSLVEGEGALSVPISVEKTIEASQTMRSMGPISADLMANWLRQWQF